MSAKPREAHHDGGDDQGRDEASGQPAAPRELGVPGLDLPERGREDEQGDRGGGAQASISHVHPPPARSSSL